MFTDITLNNPNWSQQKNHGFLIDTRHVLDSFSFGSRSLLVSSSFVSRSSLVAYSLVYRRPNENRTRNKQKTNERATRLGRESNEMPSKTRRQTIGLATRNPQTGLTLGGTTMHLLHVEVGGEVCIWVFAPHNLCAFHLIVGDFTLLRLHGLYRTGAWSLSWKLP